jgi:hypothetical protein
VLPPASNYTNPIVRPWTWCTFQPTILC